MMRRVFWRGAQIGAFVLAGTIGAPAQTQTPLALKGFISDYTLASAGAWEVRGDWSLKIDRDGGKFTANLTMERSDYWVLAAPGNPDVRTPHTHLIAMKGGQVSLIPNGFQVIGPAEITVNGSPAPFNGSRVQIAITGGTTLAYSNIKLTFLDAAQGHFGSQALSGIVRNRQAAADGGDSQD